MRFAWWIEIIMRTWYTKLFRGNTVGKSLMIQWSNSDGRTQNAQTSWGWVVPSWVEISLVVLKSFLKLSFRHGLSDQRLVMGGPKRPPLDIWLSEDIFINVFIHLSSFRCQGLESKSIAPYMKNCKSRNCLKNRRCWRKSKKIENSLFGKWTFHPKNVRQN